MTRSISDTEATSRKVCDDFENEVLPRGVFLVLNGGSIEPSYRWGSFIIQSRIYSSYEELFVEAHKVVESEVFWEVAGC